MIGESGKCKGCMTVVVKTDVVEEILPAQSLKKNGQIQEIDLKVDTKGKIKNWEQGRHRWSS